MSIQEQVTALVVGFNGGGTVDQVIVAAKNAQVPLKDAVRNWYLSTDKALSKNKATALAKDAISIWWEAKGKGEAAKTTADRSSTHALTRTVNMANGKIRDEWTPLPAVVVKHQGDVARLAVLVQKQGDIIEALKAELKSARENVKAGTITVESEVVSAKTEPAAEAPAGV